MRTVLVIALAAVLPFSSANASGFIPEPEDFRTQKVSRQAGESDWPFVATQGVLMCVKIFGLKQVVFYPGELPAQYELDQGLITNPEVVNVTTDPVTLWTDPNAAKQLIPNLSIEEKIRRMAPYVTLGKKLCDQPKGTQIGPGEL